MTRFKKIKFILIFLILSSSQASDVNPNQVFDGMASDFLNSFRSNPSFASIITNTVTPGILAKKNTNSFSFVHSTVVQFDAYNDVGADIKQMFANILFKSGIELSFGQFLSKYENYDSRINIDMFGLNYHVKFRKFSFGLHFASYKHNLPQFFSSKPRQYAISCRFHFKKLKNLVPYIYYSQTRLSPTEYFMIVATPEPAYELFSVGIWGNIGPLVLGTNITAPLEANFNLDNDLAQYKVSIGFLVN